jgi:O-methyltransferase
MGMLDRTKAVIGRTAPLSGAETAPGHQDPGLEAPAFRDLFDRCREATMTSIERMFALYQAVSYVEAAGVPGAVVECGVWRGGSSMLAALTLQQAGSDDRELWLYDTFEGMSEPDERDVSFGGEEARERYEAEDGWCASPIDEVEANMRSTGYPEHRIKLVKGKVEETIPADLPASIAILRLDTDWYESTYHELTHLYPLIADGGVIIVDDYGHWQGTKEAVDEYFAENDVHILLNRIDYTGRIGTVGAAPRPSEALS